MALKDQPSYIIKMRAKPGQGDRLFELATVGMAKSGASDRFIMLREDADPDVLWNIEVFRWRPRTPTRPAPWPTNCATRSSTSSQNRPCGSRRTPTQPYRLFRATPTEAA
jgi:hypothetical protein